MKIWKLPFHLNGWHGWTLAKIPPKKSLWIRSSTDKRTELCLNKEERYSALTCWQSSLFRYKILSLQRLRFEIAAGFICFITHLPLSKFRSSDSSNEIFCQIIVYEHWFEVFVSQPNRCYLNKLISRNLQDIHLGQTEGCAPRVLKVSIISFSQLHKM